MKARLEQIRHKMKRNHEAERPCDETALVELDL